MTILDWSPINRTPRADPCKASRQGRGDHAPPVAPARPLSGCIADYDALAEAVDDLCDGLCEECDAEENYSPIMRAWRR